MYRWDVLFLVWILNYRIGSDSHSENLFFFKCKTTTWFSFRRIFLSILYTFRDDLKNWICIVLDSFWWLIGWNGIEGGLHHSSFPLSRGELETYDKQETLIDPGVLNSLVSDVNASHKFQICSFQRQCPISNHSWNFRFCFIVSRVIAQCKSLKFPAIHF